MRRARTLVILVALIGLAVVGWLTFGAKARPAYLSGYIVGDNLELSAPVSGTIQSVSLVDGQRVAAGHSAFSIAPATLAAQGEQQAASIQANQMNVTTAQANLRQAEAQVAANRAATLRARQDLARLESVKRDDAAAVANHDLDQARAALREAEANLAATAKTADARRAEIAQADAQTQQARGAARGVQIQMSQLSPTVPAAGRVEQVYFQVGEWVSANQPIVSLVPDRKVKVRFFVPEREVAHYRPGQTITFSCDGCARRLRARIGYVSPDPEFTPPIIFSRDSRDRLVFMVEAYPEDPERLSPGLPVEVQPLS